VSKKKINKTRIQDNRSEIRSIVLKPKGVSFSFKYYQDDHSKFSAKNRTSIYWINLLERLKALSGLSAQELLVNRSSALRFHPIRWSDTSEDGFGLANEEQLVDTPYQFSLSSNEHGRVHGFFIDEVFYIVWLDPEHLLYP
jgi:hypothetical protein